MSPILRELKADWQANAGNSKGRLIVSMYRTAQIAHFASRRSLVRRVIFMPILVIYKIVMDYIMGVYIPPSVIAGGGLRVFHGVGLVLHPKVVIGRSCTLRHGVTIGVADDYGNPPRLGDCVDVGAGASIIGEVKIGDDVTVGAGAVVTRDIPSGMTAVGVPARARLKLSK